MIRRTSVAVLTAGLLALFLGGCTTPYGEPNRTGTGALIGGASGAGLGAMLSHHNPAAGMLFGGALGAVTGGLIGNSMDQQARAELYGATAPPPQVVQGPPVALAPAPTPVPRYIWINPQWVWNGQAWVWSEGHWVAEP